MAKPLRKAVFPVAGLGTRFLPATKAMPKEMLTIVDKPLIQYAVDEAFAAGIEHFIFITGRNKTIIEDHFDVQAELEEILKLRNKYKEIKILHHNLPTAGSMSFTRQQNPLGLGHAVWCARKLVGDEPFALLLPDMLMKADTPCLRIMQELYEDIGGNILSVGQCNPERVAQYGIVKPQKQAKPISRKAHIFKIEDMVEKPKPAHAPSNFYLNGRYILQPEIFDILNEQNQGTNNEIQLTDAMRKLIKSQNFYATEFHGETFDCGSKIGFLMANFSFALDQTDLKNQLTCELQNLLKSKVY